MVYNAMKGKCNRMGWKESEMGYNLMEGKGDRMGWKERELTNRKHWYKYTGDNGEDG